MTAKIDMSRADSAPKGEGPVAQTKANTVDQSHDTAINDSHRVLDLDGTNDDDYVYGRRDLSRSPSPYRRPRTRPRTRSLSRSLSFSPSRSPSPYRHRRAADRSPSPYRHRRAADRSPSPYRHRRVADRSPSPFRHSRDDRDSRSYNKRKASPPRHNRPEKRYHSDRDLHARDAASPAGAAEKELKDLPNRAAGVNQKSFRYRNAEVENSNALSNFKGGLAASDNVLKTNDGRVQYDHGQPQHRRKQKHDVPAPKSAPQPNVDEDAEMKITEDVADYVPVPVEEKVPTQESREEKKRRWAAIRAAAEQQKPKENLLQQAILTNASETTTPNVASPAQYADSPVSPYASPGNGNLDSVPASPDMMMTIGKEGFNQGNSPAADSPSAADYDPMQDMLDDRDRAARKNKTAEIPSAAYHETDPKLLSTLPAQKIVPVKKQKKEVDMFASDDEDDNDDAETGFGIEAPAKGTVLDEKLLDNWDDPEGYYKLIHNELVNGQRYRLIRALGRGVFANVVEAEETNAGGAPKLVAVKMIRRNEMMRKASQKEADFVRKLNESDPQDKRHIIRLLDTFDHKGHLCIVFEHMSKNLRDLLKDETSGHGLSLPAIRVYARQMFFALHHLQNCQVIHLDLKPDNVLVSADMKTIKLADFGTAVDKRDIIERTEYLVSRFYRAPEIILGMDIGYPVDMWAIGCTIYELWTGKILFNGSSNNQMIKAFMDCLGWPSEKLLRKGLANNVLENFELGPPLRFISREVDHLNRPYVRTIEQQKKIPRDMKTRVHEAARNMADLPAVSELNDLADLLSASLHLNVDKRLTPTEALKHKFFVNIPVPVRRPAPKVGPTFVNPTSVRRGTPGNRR